ncbi:hypothetical protein ACWEQN_30545 [Streptomyces sp. NPDC004129]
MSASKDWQDSGVEVAQGSEVEITATGKWYPFGTGNDPVGPEGCTDTRCSQDPDQPENICCMAHAGLIGKIDHGQPFAIGARRVLRDIGTGELYLRINDRYLSDDSGEMRVTIRKNFDR